MAYLKLLKGNYSKLNTTAISEGQVIVCGDTCEMFVDVTNDKRVKIGDFITVANIQELETIDVTTVPTSRLYYVEDGNILARSNGTTWVQVNKQKTVDELKILLGLGSLAYLSEVSESNLSSAMKEKIDDVVQDKHSHANKELLDTYAQTEVDLADAVAKKHAHANADELAKIVDGDKAKWDAVVDGMDAYATIKYVDSKDPYEILENGNVSFANDIIANKGVSLQKTSTNLNNLRTTVGGLESTIGNLRDYWQYSESTTNVMRAINQNAEWVMAYFEQHANKTQDIVANKTSETLYPSVKAVYDLFGPHIIYDDATGFEASDNDIGSWQLTGLNLSSYKRLKFYISSAGDGDSNWSPSHIVELHLDDRARGSNGHFTAGHTAVCPNATGRFHNVVVSVSADKTALAFNRSNRYSASTPATSIEGRRCYLIEGYLL